MTKEFEIDHLLYHVIDEVKHTVKVCRTLYTKGGDLIIPSHVTFDSVKYTVTAIGGEGSYRHTETVHVRDARYSTGYRSSSYQSSNSWNGFQGAKDINSVILPNTITEIEREAFASTRIKTIQLPKSLIRIGYRAFYDCWDLERIEIPKSVQKIDDSAFSDCKNLKVFILHSDKTDYKHAIYNCYPKIYLYEDYKKYLAHRYKATKAGALPGLFSVGENEKVRFSKGNLQYNAVKNSFRFAEHQWDMIGEGNANIGATYDGWIDLFGFGTSGCNGIKPYESSINEDKYPSESLVGSAYDWGYSPIMNGGNETGCWHTLQKNEFIYIWKERPNADKLLALATVNGVKGFLLFPDDYQYPGKGPSFVCCEEKATFDANVYTVAEWNILENSGAVFFPITGFRRGCQYFATQRVSLGNFQEEVGSYFLTTYEHVYKKPDAYVFTFYEKSWRTEDYGYFVNVGKETGRAVRLVQYVNTDSSTNDMIGNTSVSKAQIKVPKQQKEKVEKAVASTSISAAPSSASATDDPMRQPWAEKTAEALTVLENFAAQICGYDLKYNKQYIGLQKDGKSCNFATFAPKKKELLIRIDIKPSAEHEAILKNISTSYKADERGYLFSVALDAADKMSALLSIIQQAEKEHKK